MDPLEELYQKYKTPIYNYLYRSTLNQHSAEELMQETFLKAFQSIHRFRGESSLKTWLFTIARNTYLNEQNKKKRKLERLGDSEEFSDHKDDYSALNEKLLIQKILLHLPEKMRTMLLLRDQNGLTYKEIAKVLDETEGQVKIGIYRARKKFKMLYKEEVKEDSKNEAKL